MRENLHRFFRAARGAGVHVSPAESIDAMRAVAAVGFDNRTVLRDTLLLTLAKSEDEKRSLGECFDLFFDQPDLADAPPENAETDARGEGEEGAGDQPGSPPMPGAPQDGLQDGQQGGGQQEPQQGDQQPSAAGGGGVSSELGPLARMLLSGDRATLAAALANAANAAQLSNIRYFTQRGIFSTRIASRWRTVGRRLPWATTRWPLTHFSSSATLPTDAARMPGASTRTGRSEGAFGACGCSSGSRATDSAASVRRP